MRASPPVISSLPWLTDRAENYAVAACPPRPRESGRVDWRLVGASLRAARLTLHGSRRRAVAPILIHVFCPGGPRPAPGFSFAVYGVYAVAILLTSPGDALNDALTRWVYTGLFVLSVDPCARALPVPTDRVAWSVITLSSPRGASQKLYDVIVQPHGLTRPSPTSGGCRLYPLLTSGLCSSVCSGGRPRSPGTCGSTA